MITKKNHYMDVENTEENFSTEILSRCKKEDVFKTPPSYFDTLHVRINDKINYQKIKERKNVWAILSQKHLVAPIVTSILLLMGIFFINYGDKPLKTNEMNVLYDEYTLLNLAYDPSYALEVMQDNATQIENYAANTQTQPLFENKNNDNNINLDGITPEDIDQYIKSQSTENELFE